jgi:hypothetical protein
MDPSKYPVEKLIHFVAGIIPGFVALLIFEQAAPGRFHWFVNLEFLGYRTKLGLILLAAFVVGYSMTNFLMMLAGAIGGAIGAVMEMRSASSYDVAPWRDPTWRTLVRKRLGAQSPKDTLPMSRQAYEWQIKMIELKAAEERVGAIASLEIERIDSYQQDAKWEQWYGHYQTIVLQRGSNDDFQSYVQTGLRINLQAAAVCVLISAVFVPKVRLWWCMLLSCFWLLSLLAEVYWGLKRYADKWLTLFDQIKYLSGE